MASSSTRLPDTLIESFPTPSLPSIQGEPTYPQLATILRAIKGNAASIHSNHGGGANGHLGIVVLAAVYATITPNNPFNPPINPTPQHPTIPPNSTAATTSTIIRQNTKNLCKWKEYNNNIQRALKKQLATAIEKNYLKAHNDLNVGYEIITVQVLLQYLFDEYGNITPLDLLANAKRLDK
jgi:hypothetical protein